jgi:glycosyltransferase involved in cell wall biosynthesis
MIVVYAVIACACLIVLAECARFAVNVSRMRSLARANPPEPDAWPRVSVIVAGRNEADTVASAVASRFADDYPDLEIVFVDDRSSDGTGEIALAAAGGDPRFRLVRIDALPPGWLGKVHAMNEAVALATGEWLLFSDADVHIEPGALRKAIAHSIAEKIDMLALVPEYRTGSFMVDALWAIFARALALAMDPVAVRDPKRKSAIGSGAFNLVRRAAFDRTPGFEHLRLETGDDAALGLMIKENGGALELIDGHGCASVAVYRSVGEFMRGVEKNGSTTAIYPFGALVAGAIALLAIEYSPFIAIVVALSTSTPWLMWLGAVTLLATTSVNCSALWVNTRTWVAGLVWPVGLALMVYGLLRSTLLVHKRGGVLWRDTFYPLDELHAGRRFRF